MTTIDTNPAFTSALDRHLAEVKEKISAEAQVLAEGQEPTLLHLARAVERFAPGDEIYSSVASAKRTFLDYFPPVAILSAMLTMLFAILGLWAILGAPAVKDALSGQGFLDIAKIFAGAIVGSATSAAANTIRTEKIRARSAK